MSMSTDGKKENNLLTEEISLFLVFVYELNRLFLIKIPQNI